MVSAPNRQWRVAFIAVGTMAEAIVASALSNGWPRRNFVLTHRREERRAELEARLGGPVLADNAEAAERCDAVVCGARPQDYPLVLKELFSALPGRVFFSLAAALDLDWLKKRLPPGLPVIRCVPPPTTWVRAGYCLLSADEQISSDHRRLAVELLGPTAERVWWLEDRFIDAVTAVGSAATPYLSLVAAALRDTARELGLPEDIGADAVREGCRAAGIMIGRPEWTPERIISTVATPQGLTLAALDAMEGHGLPLAVRAGALKMVSRSSELRAELAVGVS